jgi:hypothetical protein
MMRDALGNSIRDGDLISWNITAELLRNMVFQVIKVQDGGVVTPDGGKTPGLLILGITLPIPEPHKELMDLRCLRNPESEDMMNKIAGMPLRKM